MLFFKQKTAYEIHQGDWSSDVCSSDLHGVFFHLRAKLKAERKEMEENAMKTNEEVMAKFQ